LKTITVPDANDAVRADSGCITAAFRHPWRRPSLRAIPAASAEIGPNTNPDGIFTQS
jgi:hypothetical protein